MASIQDANVDVALLGKRSFTTQRPDKRNPLCGRSTQWQQTATRILKVCQFQKRTPFNICACPSHVPCGAWKRSQFNCALVVAWIQKLARHPIRGIYYSITRYIKTHKILCLIGLWFHFCCTFSVFVIPYLV